jgi:uracil-DNA glycosylase family 4
LLAVCPVCAEEAIRPIGNVSSKLLIVGEFPGDSEMKFGKPFVGAAGKVLKHELSLLGLDLLQFRVTNLWLHPPTKNEDCFNFGYSQVLEEVKGKKAILLVGSEVVSTFTEYNVSDVCGLRMDKKDHMFSCNLVMCMVNTAIVFHSGIGEVRLAMQKFYKELEKDKLI